MLSQERIEAIHCYLTGHRSGDAFTVRKHWFLDRHGIARDAYNAKVEETVLRFQKDARIAVDGIWGPQTHSAARAALDRELRR